MKYEERFNVTKWDNSVGMWTELKAPRISIKITTTNCQLLNNWYIFAVKLSKILYGSSYFSEDIQAVRQYWIGL